MQACSLHTYHSGRVCPAYRENGGVPTAVTFSNGVATFDGATSKIEYPLIDLGTVHTVRFIAKRAVVSNVFMRGENADNYIGVVGPNLNYKVVGGSLSWTPLADADAETHEYVFSRNGNSVIYYLDGVSQGVKSGVGSVKLNFQYIGSVTAETMDGDMSLFEIYNYALTAEEVSNLRGL